MAKICKVLIVEDNDGVRQMLEDVFVGDGYDYVLAQNGIEMREAVAAHDDIDMLIIDVSLPGGTDGFVLAREMADAGHAVLMVTGDHRYAERIEKERHHYLLKPFRIDSLLALVAQVLQATRNTCQRRAS